MSETRSLSLRDYVQHMDDCELVNTWTAQQKCTCGLDDALRAQEPKARTIEDEMGWTPHRTRTQEPPQA